MKKINTKLLFTYIGFFGSGLLVFMLLDLNKEGNPNIGYILSVISTVLSIIMAFVFASKKSK